MHLLFLPVLVIAIVTAFFNTPWGVGIFLSVFGLFEAYVWATDVLARPKMEPYMNELGLGVEETRVFRKYHLFFRYPSACTGFSGLLSAIQLSTLVWVPLLLFKHFWIPAIIIGINWFLAGLLAMRLNPPRFLNDMVQKGHTVFITELATFNSLCEKVYESRDKRTESDVE